MLCILMASKLAALTVRHAALTARGVFSCSQVVNCELFNRPSSSMCFLMVPTSRIGIWSASRARI